MTVTKKQKLEPKKQIILSILTNGSPVLWRVPEDHSRDFAKGIDPWVELAQKAEKGKIHAIFIADHLTLFDAYDGPNNFRHPLRYASTAPRVSPSEAVAAIALKTKNIGIGITFSTSFEHPYHFARRIATLDHITNGRIGWNIVTGFLDNIGRQLLNGAPFPEHDERYVQAEEFLKVTYDLLLSSWRDDAIVYDKKTGLFADPDRVREINHKGKYYDVPGPAITEPTPQRFPVIIQAGASAKGKHFAAANAEIVFLDGRVRERMRNVIVEIKNLAKTEYHRDPNSLKFLVYGTPILGKTHEEAVAKAAKIGSYSNIIASQVGFGGVSGFDLSKYEMDDPVDLNKSNGIQTITKNTLHTKKGPLTTKREILENYSSKATTFIGTAAEVADVLETWVKEDGVDGFNFGMAVYPSSIDDIVDLLVPELQKRGIYHEEYTGTTYRENLFEEKGRSYLYEDHPAHKLRWTSDLSVEEFEKKINT